MKSHKPSTEFCGDRKAVIPALAFAAIITFGGGIWPAWAADAPLPLVEAGKAVDWWFAFKFNSQNFAGCGDDSGPRTCAFGGKPQPYKHSQQFAFAFKSVDEESGKLQHGKSCIGTTARDPLGATFDQVYNGTFNYVIWNDQFYKDPAIRICGNANGCTGSWGHSKGMLAWNDDGEGFILQVTTPSWPGAGSKKHPRKVKSGNTLGCVVNNNVKFSQHFFALRLNKTDMVQVLRALANASVVTEPSNAQIVRNGGPPDVRQLVDELGKKSKSEEVILAKLSTGVTMISKPSKLTVPPWQLVSILLGSEGNRNATWWASPRIPSSTKTSEIRCLEPGMKKPGPVAIATTGQWDDKDLGLIGGQNHAKIGVTTTGDKHYAIFGDLNQQGTLSPPKCERSQNGRGGLFFVVEDKALFDSVTDLLKGDTAPSKVPKK